MVLATPAAFSSALLGTHPVQVQSPPRRPASISAVLAPSEAEIPAAVSPAAPPPITTMSKSNAICALAIDTACPELKLLFESPIVKLYTTTSSSMRARSRWIQSLPCRTSSPARHHLPINSLRRRVQRYALLSRSFKAQSLSKNVGSRFGQEVCLKRFAAHTTADDILKHLPRNVHPTADTERVDLAAVQPAVKR